MKVLKVVRDFAYPLGGLEEHLFRVSTGLAKRGIDVTVFTSTRFTKKDRVTEERLNGVRLMRFTIDASLHGYCFSKALAKALQSEKCDIIHAHGWGNYFIDIAYRTSRKRKIPFVITPHAFFQDPSRAKLLKNAYNKLLAKPLLQNAFFIALTKAQRHELQEMGAKKVEVIPDGVDLEELSKPRPKPLHIIPEDTESILCVGRVAKYKGIEHVLLALKQVLKSLPKTRLVVAGPDWGYLNKLKAITEKLGLEKNVVFTGKVSREELIALYQHTDIFVNASLYEGFGIAIIEAMACKKPVISTKTGVAQDLPNIPTFEYGDYKALAKHLLKLLKDSDLRKKIGEENHKIVEQRYTWKTVIESLINIYQNILQQLHHS